jgi:hypothetical protein
MGGNMAEWLPTVQGAMDMNVQAADERLFYADEWLSRELLAQYPVNRLVELGMVRDPDGGVPLRVPRWGVVAEDERGVLYRFFGYSRV